MCMCSPRHQMVDFKRNWFDQIPPVLFNMTVANGNALKCVILSKVRGLRQTGGGMCVSLPFVVD
jgi:hypothetical protein